MSSKDKLLHPVDRQARLTSLSYAGFQDPKVLGNLSDLRAEPALSRGLNKKHPEVPSSLYDPNICYCSSESRIIKI